MKTAILGAGGRMGRMLLREVIAGGHGATLGAAVDHGASGAAGQDAGVLAGLDPCGVAVTQDARAAFDSCDLVIDFTAPAALAAHAALASEYKKPLVVGTTGLDAVQERALEQAARAAPVLRSANMSLGVNLIAALVEQAAARLGAEYDIEIFDAHHRHKADAPSGTALLLADTAARARGVDVKNAVIPARHGHTGPRPRGAIGVCVFRGGDVVGDHTVTFAGEGERVEISHKASDRAIFARGAVRGGLWLQGRAPGLYSMRDVLGL